MNLFRDSFATVGAVNQKWTSTTSDIAPTAPGRLDAFCGGGSTQLSCWKYLGTNSQTLFFGGAFKFQNMLSGDVLVNFDDSGTPATVLGTSQVGIAMNADGSIQVKRNGTNIGSASAAAVYSTNTWFYLEFGAVIDPTVGTATVKINGVTVISLTGQNTRATSNSYANQLAVGTGAIFSAYRVDDVYVNDNTGSYNNTFLGDIKVIGSTPTGDSATSAWTQNVAAWAASTSYAVGTTILDSNNNLQRCTTAGTSKVAPHPTWNASVAGTTTDNTATWTNIDVQAAYRLVNETTADDDSAYLSDSTVTNQSRFTFPAVTGNGVLAVAVYARARKDDAGTRSIRLVAKSGATTGDNGSDLAQSSTYQYFSGLFETDPNTSAPWTVGNVNAAEFGIKTTA